MLVYNWDTKLKEYHFMTTPCEKCQVHWEHQKDKEKPLLDQTLHCSYKNTHIMNSKREPQFWKKVGRLKIIATLGEKIISRFLDSYTFAGSLRPFFGLCFSQVAFTFRSFPHLNLMRRKKYFFSLKASGQWLLRHFKKEKLCRIFK